MSILHHNFHLHGSNDFDVIVLGTLPLTPLMVHLIKRAHRVYCTDNGADVLLDSLPSIVPFAVCGNFNGISKTACDTYRSMGSRMEKQDDENTNDLYKSLNYIVKDVKIPTNVQKTIYILGTELRVDHQFANFDAMYHFGRSACLQLVLVSQSCQSFILQPDIVHQINVDSTLECGTCGIIPLFEPVRRVSTSGLKWNLNGTPLQFGKIVSTSNQMVHNKATVQASEPVLWTSCWAKDLKINTGA